MRKVRGSIIILALLTLTILFILGLGILGSRPAHREAAQDAMDSCAARQLAISGLEDVRAKLTHDMFFPPPFNSTQNIFSYTEKVLNPDTSLYGAYEVQLDGTKMAAPYLLLSVRSTGYLYRNGSWLSQWVMEAELDLSPVTRPGGAANPLFKDFTTVFDRNSQF